MPLASRWTLMGLRTGLWPMNAWRAINWTEFRVVHCPYAGKLLPKPARMQVFPVGLVVVCCRDDPHQVRPICAYSRASHSAHATENYISVDSPDMRRILCE